MVRRRQSLFGLSLVLGVALGCGMGCREPQPQPFQVQMVAIDAHGGPTLPEERVRAILRRSLERTPSFVHAERNQRSGGRQALMATLEYRELPDSIDHGRDLLVRLQVESPPRLAGRLGPTGLDVTVLLERAAGEADLAVDLQLAVDRLATMLQARTDLALATPGTLDRLLRSNDGELTRLALGWIRDHPHEPDAVAAADRVTELINHDDADIGLLALDTIGRIGGPQHVSAVLERIRLHDTPQVNRAYNALSQLGGPEAEGFLEFAARNEDEPDRRAAAKRALQRVADSDMVGGPRRRQPTRGHR